ncbi:DUF1826 domain-containing protein [Marinobacter confluentis]|uniref:DUF1826 domain-containing protein n=1 Tax=Marinobacter confluentis TaxID=1697557 RepID=A0A4Z1BQC5_9GAMM|nr:DUF1826 domain-containing protein [Marinobacter confluentis]TGN39251.1 DUF1826 domain-containing protein [Marinobacter confluentis]
MTLNPAALEKPVAVTGDQPECLTQIFRDEVNLTVWNRALRPQVVRFADALAAWEGKLERFVTLKQGDSAALVLPQWALAEEGARSWIADADEIIDMYRCLFEPEAVGLRLHVLRGTMCPRFHVDRVPVRLLCTYRGIGTEWLEESQVTRPQGPGPLPDQSVTDRAVRRLSTGAVGLLKGEAWEGNEGRGLVHRSPAPGNQSRLVLALDWL